MTSKKLGALLRSVPPATAPAVEDALSSPLVQPAAETAKPLTAETASTPKAHIEPTAIEPEVPLQVLVPAHVRRQLAIKAAEQEESIRSLVLKALLGLGLEVSDADIKGKSRRRNA